MANVLEFLDKPKSVRFQDLEGKVFGRLKVVGFAGRFKNNTFWYCNCDCGVVVKIRAGHLNSGFTASCGCLLVEVRKKHGHSSRRKYSGTYKSWESMLQRCNNVKSPSYQNYGGRGIKVCENWGKFENFLADMGERPEGKTIDRIENDKGYYKGNCRWATKYQQCNNKRTNVLITHNGKTQNVTQWAVELGIKKNTMYGRLLKGKSILG